MEDEHVSPVTFVFLDSWTLNTDRVDGMLHAMEQHGFIVMGHQYKTLCEADAEEIYRINKPIREDNSWHVARLVYPMGRSLGLLLARRDGACACESMRRLKGKANPRLQRKGELRFDFMAPNRCLSLMHSSDDLSQVYREGAVFFGRERIADSLVASRAGIYGEGSHWRGVDTSIGTGIERIEEPGLGALFARVRMRIAMVLKMGTFGRREASQKVIEDYMAIWADMSTRTGRKHVLDEAQDYLELVERERPVLDRVLQVYRAAALEPCQYAELYRTDWLETERLVQCLWVLSQPSRYPRWDVERQLLTGVLYDRWEILLFKTHLFNFDDCIARSWERTQ